jgi:transcriptional regulator with XRE-family HTH domain
MIPNELITWRKKHGLTQEGLATMLGVTKPCISQWESGKRTIPTFLHLALKCLKVKKGGELKTKGTKKKKEVKKSERKYPEKT